MHFAPFSISPFPQSSPIALFAQFSICSGGGTDLNKSTQLQQRIRTSVADSIENIMWSSRVSRHVDLPSLYSECIEMENYSPTTN